MNKPLWTELENQKPVKLLIEAFLRDFCKHGRPVILNASELKACLEFSLYPKSQKPSGPSQVNGVFFDEDYFDGFDTEEPKMFFYQDLPVGGLREQNELTEMLDRSPKTVWNVRFVRTSTKDRLDFFHKLKEVQGNSFEIFPLEGL